MSSPLAARDALWIIEVVMKKLTKEAKEKIYQAIRYWTEDQKKVIRPMGAHIEWCEKRIRTLEQEIDRLKQKPLFLDMEKAQRIEANRIRLQESLSEEQQVFDKSRFFYELKLQGRTDSDEWRRCCKWLKIDHEQALKLADDYQGG